VNLPAVEVSRWVDSKLALEASIPTVGDLYRVGRLGSTQPTNNNTTTYIEPANKDVCISNPFKQATAYVRPLNVSSHLFIDTLLVLLDLLAAIKCT